MIALDRLLGAVAYRLHALFARRLSESPRITRAVAGHAARWRGVDLAQSVPDLRYRLRRDGLRRPLVLESFGLYAAGLPALPHARVLAAAGALVRGGVVELSDVAERRCALALAALARVLHGERIHLLSGSDASAKALYELVAPAFSALGVPVGCVLRSTPALQRRQAYAHGVVCAAHREVAQDHLRDRLQSRHAGGTLMARVHGLADGTDRLMVGELDGALVEDADLLMLDDAQAPVAIAAEIDQSAERLLYEQAIELARGLKHDSDFTIHDEGIHLSAPAAALLERLVAPLGGVWSARQRREELIALALEALHLFRRDLDYRVQGGQVLFPPRPQEGEAPPGPDEQIQKLIEVKEGCRLSARRDILARLSVPRFFGRYRRLSGICAEARSLESEYWTLYGLKTWLAGSRCAASAAGVRVFATARDKHAAMLDTVRAACNAKQAVIIAVRRAAQAQEIQALLQTAALGEAAVTFALLPAMQPPASATGGQPAVIVAELPDSQRHVAQLGKQCDAERCTMLLSLDEEAVCARLGAASARIAQIALRGKPELSPALASWLASRAQREAERALRGARLELKARDQMLDDLLAFAGQGE